MSSHMFLKTLTRTVVVLLVISVGFVNGDTRKDIQSDRQIKEIKFKQNELPPTLHSMMHRQNSNPVMKVSLPRNFDRNKSYPVIVYLGDKDGGPSGDIKAALDIVKNRDWIAVSLPLFKREINKAEPAGGMLVSMEDYQTISSAYRTMLLRLFEIVPNIDPEQSMMAGFSNGAITISVLVSNQDKFILAHFRNFCLVDDGVFHLADLHKETTRKCRFLVMLGEKEGWGRNLKNKQAQLRKEMASMLGMDFTVVRMKNIGHEFPRQQRQEVAMWLSEKQESYLAESQERATRDREKEKPKRIASDE